MSGQDDMLTAAKGKHAGLNQVKVVDCTQRHMCAKLFRRQFVSLAFKRHYSSHLALSHFYSFLGYIDSSLQGVEAKPETSNASELHTYHWLVPLKISDHNCVQLSCVCVF